MEPITRWSGFSRFTFPVHTGEDGVRQLYGTINQTGSDRRTCAMFLHVVRWDWLDGHQVLGLSVWNKMMDSGFKTSD